MRTILCLWVLLTTACVHADSLNPYPVKPKVIPEYISIAYGVHPIRFPLAFLRNSEISVGNSLTIILPAKKGLTIGNHTKEQWQPISVQTNQIPEIIFRGDFSRIKDSDFRKQLIATRKIIISKDVTDIGYIKQEDISLYIAIGDDISTIFLTSKMHPDKFTQIGTSGLSKKEIEENIIQGALQ